MNHHEIKNNLSNYYDGELPLEKFSTILAHLPSCPECQTELKRFKKMSDIISNSVSVPSTDNFTDRVMNKINDLTETRDQRRIFWRSWFMRWLSPVTIGLALAGFCLVLVAPIDESLGTYERLLSPTTEKIPSEVYGVEPSGNSTMINYIVGEL